MQRRQWDEAAGDHTGQGPRVQLSSDEAIRAEVSDLLAADRHIDASRITVAVSSGVVELDGMVTIIADRHHAEQTAAAVAGVVAVRDRLMVG